MSANLQELIDAYLDGSATPEIIESLDRALVEDNEVRIQFLKSANLVTELQLVLGKDATVEEIPPMPAPAIHRFNWRPLAIAACVATSLVTLFFAMKRPAGKMAEPKSAESVVLVEGKVQTDNGVMNVGEHCEPPAHLTVSNEEGAVFQFPDGTIVTLEQGSALQLKTGTESKMLFLERGALFADVQPQPVGKEMITETPNAKITVLGTSFRLATTFIEDELIVEHGKVRILEKKTGTTQIAEKGAPYRISGVAETKLAPNLTAVEPETPRPAQYPAANYVIGKDWWFTEDFEKVHLPNLWLSHAQGAPYEYDYSGDEPHATIIRTEARSGQTKNVLRLSRPLKTSGSVRFRLRKTPEWQNFRLIYNIKPIGDETINLSPHRLRLQEGVEEKIVFQKNGADPLTKSNSWHREEFQFHRFWDGEEWQVEIRRYLDKNHISTVRLRIEEIPYIQFELNAGSCLLDFITTRELVPAVDEPRAPTSNNEK